MELTAPHDGGVLVSIAIPFHIAMAGKRLRLVVIRTRTA
jgi:hypothetical protein